MFILVCYDIPSDRRRTKVMKTLKDYGRHVQYSVFECELTAKSYRKLQQELRKLVSKQEDNVRFYPINQEDVGKRQLWGKQRTEQEIQAFYIVGGKGQEGKGQE
jgi:CRISPR-associated protein Cas2